MNENNIAYDKELEEIEVQLKELSKIYQDEYEESGKYFKPSNPKLILWFFYLPVITILVLKNQFNLISYETSLILFLIVYIFCFLLISKKIKLPIVKKSTFVQDKYNKIKFDLKSKYNLEMDYILIDYKNIEFHLHQKAFARFKKIKK